ncbi:putative membrane-bound dehydrogenase domain-containing protein [Dyadobacter sp. SG02]|uniref:PVC-type heme-binding CxxCH protein n=1 Tax=Dyadobacter sp. SG02 TaxID=1855291 RepID=UPI0008AFC6D3|nr:PVC-type heme-binding CxxCH protein [Dyadobacter sp. SG02]SEI59091.1 putative membrane-bound dehydrogenase domain-containing protein [Dyadobacter sp. SG02]
MIAVRHSFVVLCIVVATSIAPALAQDKTHSVRTGANTPEQELAGFHVPEGFVVELVASERDSVFKPIDITFDDAGRLWTQTARMYPLDPISDIQWEDLLKLMDDEKAQRNHPNFKRVLRLYKGETRGTDKVIVLSNIYGNGKVKPTVWADGLTIPMSVLPYRNGAYIAQGSELFFMDDTDYDGKADRRVPLFTGFGFTDSHTMAHVLVRAPGNWIHFSHGALNKGRVRSLVSGDSLKIDFSKIARFTPDGRKMELVNAGLNNIWGFQLRGNGQWYGSEANDLGYSVVPMEPGTAFPGPGNEKLRSYQPFMPALHSFRVGGTGISGTAFADDASGSFPEAFRDVAFLANPITSTINAVKIVRNGDGTVSATHLPDLLTSDDDWFRPVNMEFGPDGCLYIADWYNKIVSHNELPTTHPDRDKTRGRIWRIRHVSQQPRDIPDFYRMQVSRLPEYLRSPSLWAKRAAWHQIADRPKAETTALISGITAIAADRAADDATRIHALWCLESLQYYDAALISSMLADPHDNVRREAVRSLTGFKLNGTQIATLVKVSAGDPDHQVRSQVLRTLGEAAELDVNGIALLVAACKPELPGDMLGGPYERRFERFLARMALEKHSMALNRFISGPDVAGVPVENLLWATQALPKNDRDAAFIRFWPEAHIEKLDEPTFISMAAMLSNKNIAAMMKPAFETPQATEYVRFAIRNQAQVQSTELNRLLTAPVSRLLKSDDQAEIDLGLDAVGRFGMRNSVGQVLAVLDRDMPAASVKLALRAIDADPVLGKNALVKTVNNASYGFDVRTTALLALAKAEPTAARLAAEKWVPGLDVVEKGELVKMLPSSPAGADLLMYLIKNKQLNGSSLDVPTAERLVAVRRNPETTGLLSRAKSVETEKKKAFKTRLHKYMTVAAQQKGDQEAGRALFQTCLNCHQVGGKGQNIAPSLDGSANRETEALLTAILDPDAAVESGYTVYRVTQKDGTNFEGYLVSQDKRGTTLAFMGGAKTFIPSDQIKSQGALGGRSFMIKGLIDTYSDRQVADLLSYIRTLK